MGEKTVHGDGMHVPLTTNAVTAWLAFNTMATRDVVSQKKASHLLVVPKNSPLA